MILKDLPAAGWSGASAVVFLLAATALVPPRLRDYLRDVGARLGSAPAARDRRVVAPTEVQVHSALIAGVSAGLAGAEDVHQLLDRAVRAIADALDYHSVTLFLFPEGTRASDPGAEMEAVAAAGAAPPVPRESPSALHQSVDVGLLGRAARVNEVVLASNVALEPDFHARPGTEAVRSELCVPLRLGNEVLGVLDVASDRTHAFTEHDVRTASVLADQMAMAIGRSRLDKERAARSAELEQLRLFNEGIVQGIREGIAVTDEHGAITFVNRRFGAMLGLAPDDLIGRPWHELLPEAWRQPLRSGLPDTERFEARVLTKDGGQLAVQVGVQPRLDDAGGGVILLFTDISGRVRFEAVARALTEAGVSLQAAPTEDALRAVLTEQAVRTGLRVVVLATEDSRAVGHVRCASLDSRGARLLERALGVRLPEATLGLAPADPLALVLAGPDPVFEAWPGRLIDALLPGGRAGRGDRVARRLGLGPCLLVPMRMGAGRAWTVCVSHPQLEESDMPAATVFANQVATAMDRARLRSETTQRQRQVAVLAEAAQHLAATADVRDLAAGVTEQVRRVFGAEAATLYVYDEAQEQLELAAAAGFSDAERDVAERTAWSRHPGWVIRHRQPLLAGDGAQDPRVVYIGSRPRFSSVMAAPLLIEGTRSIGSLGVASRRMFVWSAADLELLSTLAHQVAVAVANALRVREASSRAFQLERVSVANRRITASLAVADLLQRAATESAQVFDASHVSLFLLGEDERVAQWAHHPPGAPILNEHDDELSWISGYRRPVVVRDLRDTQTLPGLKLRLVERGVHSAIIAPLVLHDRVIGGLILLAVAGRKGFGHAAQELAQISADQLAVAVENARLYQESVDARERTETVVQSSFTAMLTVDTVGRVRDANPAAAHLLGAPREVLQNRLLDAVLGSDIWLDPDGPIAAARRSGSIVSPRECVLSLRGGRSEREVLMGVAPLTDGYLISMADITRLKELDRLKTELVANVSHELRSPLASIKAYTELLLDGLVPDQRTFDEFLGIIDDQADRLGQCIENILDLSRVEADGYVVRRERFALGPFIQEAVDAVSIRADGKDIELQRVADPSEPLTVHGDRPILFSSLKNLIDNAVKYSPPGTKVVVHTTYDSEGLEVAVSDQGPGIAPDEVARVFEKFYRVPSPTGNRVEGSGLGLVIARQAARAHGGDVKVASELGRGSTFVLRLPASMIERAPTDGVEAPSTQRF